MSFYFIMAQSGTLSLEREMLLQWHKGASLLCAVLFFSESSSVYQVFPYPALNLLNCGFSVENVNLVFCEPRVRENTSCFTLDSLS